tara:strand:+ start:404 stop:1276 length:873 start_codon:yes stop_codon:yes gene_type:complete
MTIKNLVLSGGSWKGFHMIGSIDKLIDEKYIVKDEIESIWGTSVGTLVAVLFCLKIEWKDILSYFINLPLTAYNNLKMDFYLNAFKECGLFDQKFFLILLNSLFNSEQLNINEITLEGFYKYSNIELNFFTVNYETMETVGLNYKTRPTLKLIDAIYCSCSLPLLFKPKKIDNIIHLDGGLNVHYPVEYCLKEKVASETFGIYIKSINKLDNSPNILEFGLSLIYKIIFRNSRKTIGILKNEIVISCETIGLDGIFEIIKNKDLRRKKMDEGNMVSSTFLETTFFQKKVD